jgi:hypothetical protein
MWRLILKVKMAVQYKSDCDNLGSNPVAENCSDMSASHRKFGELLEEGIKRVHITRKKPIGFILDEFGYELRPDDSSKGRHALGHWYYKRRIPAGMEDVEKLAELIVTNSDVEREWLKAFLESAGYPEADKFCSRFFRAKPDDKPVVENSMQEQEPEVQISTEPILIPNEDQPIRHVRSRILYAIGIVIILLAAIFFIGRQHLTPKPAVDAVPTQPNVLQSNSPTPPSIQKTAPPNTEPSVSPSFTSTPDLASFDGKCPAVSLTTAFEYISPQSFMDFLNAGGSFAALQSGFNALVQKHVNLRDGQITSVDLTGDGVDEVIVDAILDKGSIWQVLGCNSGHYQALVNNEDTGFRYLRFAVDLNGNKLPDIISYRQTRPKSTQLFEFFIQAWNGHQIADLLDYTRFDEVGRRLPSDITDWNKTVPNATGTTRDTNGDGLYELVVTGGLVTPVPNCETRFERQFTEIWAWNGKSFQMADRVYIPPIYRFQRSADGDLAFALKQYDLALTAYQDVLFDVNLFARDQYLPQLGYCKGIAAASDIAAVENEQDQLQAYARWRILLINTLEGNKDAMQVVYQTLQDKFSDGKPGHSYAAIASAFWEQYQSTQNIKAACDAANAAAKDQQLYPGHTADNICFVP